MGEILLFDFGSELNAAKSSGSCCVLDCPFVGVALIMLVYSSLAMMDSYLDDDDVPKKSKSNVEAWGCGCCCTCGCVANAFPFDGTKNGLLIFDVVANGFCGCGCICGVGVGDDTLRTIRNGFTVFLVNCLLDSEAKLKGFVEGYAAGAGFGVGFTKGAE
jgi:hypothetical protein